MHSHTSAYTSQTRRWLLRSLILFVVIGSSSYLGFAQALSGLIGPHNLAPSLGSSRSIGAVPGTRIDLASLRGKVVVLEFWATWCVPCVEEIPFINTLVKASDPSKVQIISLTDESPDLIARFVKRYPISGWVATDVTSKVFDRYGISIRPTTIVIDPAGHVVSNKLRPRELSAAQLEDVALGKATEVTPTFTLHARKRAMASTTEANGTIAATEDSSKALLRLTLTEATGDSPAHLYRYAPGSFDLFNASLKTIMELALGYNEERITANTNLSTTIKYNLSLRATDVTSDRLNALIETAVASGAHLPIEHNSTVEDVLILERLSHGDSTAAAGSGQNVAFYDPVRHSFVMLQASSHWIASAAEDALSVPVVETDNGSQCNGKFDLVKGDVAHLTEALERECGLTLTRSRRPVDRISISKAAPRGN